MGAAAFALANAVPEIMCDVVPGHAAVAATSGTALLIQVKDVLVPPGFPSLVVPLGFSWLLAWSTAS